jgi:hypothetical protein
MVSKPDALNPLICDVVNPLALPMLPLQKIIAVVAEAFGPAISNASNIVETSDKRMTRGTRKENCLGGCPGKCIRPDYTETRLFSCGINWPLCFKSKPVSGGTFFADFAPVCSNNPGP